MSMSISMSLTRALSALTDEKCDAFTDSNKSWQTALETRLHYSRASVWKSNKNEGLNHFPTPSFPVEASELQSERILITFEYGLRVPLCLYLSLEAYSTLFNSVMWSVIYRLNQLIVNTCLKIYWNIHNNPSSAYSEQDSVINSLDLAPLSNTKP